MKPYLRAHINGWFQKKQIVAIEPADNPSHHSYHAHITKFGSGVYRGLAEDDRIDWVIADKPLWSRDFFEDMELLNTFCRARQGVVALGRLAADTLFGMTKHSTQWQMQNREFFYETWQENPENRCDRLVPDQTLTEYLRRLQPDLELIVFLTANSTELEVQEFVADAIQSYEGDDVLSAVFNGTQPFLPHETEAPFCDNSDYLRLDRDTTAVLSA